MLYPLKFEPILKSILWGGDEICKFKQIDPPRDGIGESWEISGVSGDISVVSNGNLKGKSLNELMDSYGEQLLGQPVMKRFGTTFPLLIKFIDAKQPLSVQVHPNDELAQKRHHSFGKTEMWYVVKADEGAFLYSGFCEEINAEKYMQSLQDDSFIRYLQKHNVKSGDVFFLPAGRVHAIGAGCFIAEIQQTSNITYRIYDYNRKDAQGNFRELHTEQAKEAIDYRLYSDYQLNYSPGAAEVQELIKCSYFTTRLIEGGEGKSIQLTHEDSFVIYICLQGKLQLTDSQRNAANLRQGETLLVPAANSRQIELNLEEESKLLETFVS
ncbi:MAG: mannose-6-phosphate isomerase [Candidatus Azobacteroides sp.]|nr:mannose-6-phosphate isomerase [Candidatus Azobacteroides sp.]